MITNILLNSCRIIWKIEEFCKWYFELILFLLVWFLSLYRLWNSLFLIFHVWSIKRQLFWPLSAFIIIRYIAFLNEGTWTIDKERKLVSGKLLFRSQERTKSYMYDINHYYFFYYFTVWKKSQHYYVE